MAFRLYSDIAKDLTTETKRGENRTTKDVIVVGYG